MGILGFGLLGLTFVALCVVVLFIPDENKKENETSEQDSSAIESDLINNILDDLPNLLFNGVNISKDVYCKSIVECRIFALHFLLMIKDKVDDRLARQYDDAVLETYYQVQDISPMNKEQFMEYFKGRCRLYTRLYNDIGNKLYRVEKVKIPIEFNGLKYLVCTVPLKRVDYNDIQQQMLYTDNDLSNLVPFSQNVLDAYKFIDLSIELYIRGRL